MVLEFIFLFGYLNLTLLPSEKSQEMIRKTSLMHIKLIKIFEYEKNNNKYWDRAKLY